MTTYHPFKVNLSKGQKEKLARAYKTSSPLTLRLKNNQLTGNDELMLTSQQINKINKAKSQGKGSDIKISKPNIRSVTREGGSLFSAIIPLAKTLAPMIGKTLGLSALAGLASEGASQLVKKIGGKEQIGGYLVENNMIEKLIPLEKILTNKQKQDILTALHNKTRLFIKPTQEL